VAEAGQNLLDEIQLPTILVALTVGLPVRPYVAVLIYGSVFSVWRKATSLSGGSPRTEPWRVSTSALRILRSAIRMGPSGRLKWSVYFPTAV